MRGLKRPQEAIRGAKQALTAGHGDEDPLFESTDDRLIKVPRQGGCAEHDDKLGRVMLAVLGLVPQPCVTRRRRDSGQQHR